MTPVPSQKPLDVPPKQPVLRDSGQASGVGNRGVQPPAGATTNTAMRAPDDRSIDGQDER